VTRFVELGHVLEDGMPTYPGLLPPIMIGAHLTHEQSRPRYQGKAEFYLGKVEMPGNAGTYLDSPFHRFPGREDLSRIPLESVAGLPGLLVDATGQGREILIAAREDELRGKAVLIRTGWDERWGTDSFWDPDPYLSAPSLDLLVRSRPSLVGVDFRNVDDTDDPARPAHTRLLDEGILIVEALRGLDQLPREGFRFFAVPLRIINGAAFPVRAFAELPD
jgi:kynurenine formamidase